MTSAGGRRRMHLGFFMQMSGIHYAAWRHPDARPQETTSFHYYADMVRQLEAAKFDFVFCADSLSAAYGDKGRQERTKSTLMRKEPQRLVEPLTLISALSAVTRHIGLVATATTTYAEPYNLARMFASLDHLSGGRAGWNIVTGAHAAEAQNFGRTLLSHADRYARAEEFVAVVRGLWDTIDDGALVRDKHSGVYVDESRFRFLDHKGANFSVRGPLNIPRPPQGHPVLVQAGSSDTGLDFAARNAELAFTAQPELEGARRFYRDLKDRAAAAGRAHPPLIMPGIVTFVGRTEAEARQRYDDLQSLLDPELGLFLLSDMLGGADLSGLPLDGPLPEDLPETEGLKSRMELLRVTARRQNLSIRGLYQWFCSSNGHGLVIGSPGQIADRLQHWFENGAADGFVVMPASLPGSCRDFAELVVPELRRRGLFRADYEGGMLRDHLRLPRPASTFAGEAAPADA